MNAALWVTVGVVLAAVAVLVVGALRYRALRRRVGSFDCSLRRGPDGPWTQGIAHYAVGRIDWWRAHTLSMRPERTWSRHALTIVSRAAVAGGAACIVRCTCSGEELTLLMSQAAYAGLASWLEAAPPQRRLVV